MEVKLDDRTVWSEASITETQHVRVIVDDSQEQDHTLQWVLSGKLPEHTVVDEQGNIVQDSVVSIREVQVDNIQIDTHIFNLATYTHNSNGNSETKTDPMYADLGCNGVAELKFKTPVYLWILETL